MPSSNGPEDITNTGEATSSRPPLRTWRIVMHPDKTALDPGPYPVLAILSTLIHEAVHILLDKYGCHHCATWNENQQAIWHGRPWQLVAAKLEEVVPRLLGIPIKLGRLHSLLHGWGWQYLLPSRHDIAAYGLSSVRLWSEEDEDLKELIAATARLHKYQPVHIPTGTRCWDNEPFMNGDTFKVIPETYHIRTERGTLRTGQPTGEIGDGRDIPEGHPVYGYDSRLDTGIGLGGTKVRSIEEAIGHDGKEDQKERKVEHDTSSELATTQIAEEDHVDEEGTGTGSGDADEIFWDAEDGERGGEVARGEGDARSTREHQKKDEQTESKAGHDTPAEQGKDAIEHGSEEESPQ
jgi:hypothetical protein